MPDPLITPKMKVAQLLESFPQLESVLLEISPAFTKLRNPVLRNTVARVATLQQAAQVGNVDVGTMVNRLRSAAGQDPLVESVGGSSYVTAKPDWFAEEKVIGTTDVAAMLESGDHPVHAVIAELQRLPPGAVHKVIAPFVPAPLLDKARTLGIEHWIAEGGEKTVVYFSKRG